MTPWSQRFRPLWTTPLRPIAATETRSSVCDDEGNVRWVPADEIEPLKPEVDP